MKRAALLVAVAACVPPAPPRDPAIAKLEQRVATLEAAAHPPGAGSGSAELADVAARVDDLELLAREERVLQKDLQSLLTRVSDRIANAPAPLAATVRVENLDPARRYRIVIAGSPSFGEPAAGVTIVLATQFPERFTHALFPALRAVRQKFGAEVRVVVQGFVANPEALASTIAACTVAHQGPDALDKFEDALATMRELAQSDPGKPWPDADDARTAAGGANLDLKRYDAELPACAKSVDREQRALALAGQTAAPTLWINGRPIVGAKSEVQLSAIVDAELAAAKADRDKGGIAKTYYERLMKTATSK